MGSLTWLGEDDESAQWGRTTQGGPIVTQGGVVFLATTNDKKLHALNGANGNLLSKWDLSAAPHSTPMSFRFSGSDYVVVMAGGDLSEGPGRPGRGDYVIAFSLPGGLAN